MAESTGISWADATFNPWVGCSKVSPGCAHCYAETLVQGRMGRGGTWGDGGVREVTARSTWSKPRIWARTKPAELGRRPRIFCASLADVFEDRPEVAAARFALFDLIDETPELDWLILTKRPELALEWLQRWYVEYAVRTGRMVAEWSTRDGLGWGMPPNVWLGVSIENARHTYRADVLREIPAAVRFISAEPLLGSLLVAPAGICGTCGHSTHDHRSGFCDTEIRDYGQTDCGCKRQFPQPLDLTGVDWVIVGGESGGRQARPMHPQWFREIRDACADHDIPLHGKQWGSWTPDPHGRDRNGVWVSPDGRVRSSLAADAYDDLPDGSARMRYAGSAPTSGGKHLDGVDHCAFPLEAVPA